MKPLNRWTNTTAARAVLLMVFPIALIVSIVAGAWFGMKDAVKDLWGAARNVWKNDQ